MAGIAAAINGILPNVNIVCEHRVFTPQRLS